MLPAGLELNAGPLRLALRPELGAAMAGLWRNGLPVLHSAEPAALTTPRPSGGFVLAPYSNRLGDRRFHWRGQHFTTALNTAGSHLQIDLSHRWDSDPITRLPSCRQPQPGIDADVAQLAFDHCVEGWRGAALIRDEALSMRLSASVPFLVVFTPADKPYFCVEPVSHVNNAIGMTDPAAHGLRDLAGGATLEASFLLEIAPARPLPAALT
jgi:galactose mutarotase-like enzyme